MDASDGGVRERWWLPLGATLLLTTYYVAVKIRVIDFRPDLHDYALAIVDTEDAMPHRPGQLLRQLALLRASPRWREVFAEDGRRFVFKRDRGDAE